MKYEDVCSTSHWLSEIYVGNYKYNMTHDLYQKVNFNQQFLGKQKKTCTINKLSDETSFLSKSNIGTQELDLAQKVWMVQ